MSKPIANLPCIATHARAFTAKHVTLPIPLLCVSLWASPLYAFRHVLARHTSLHVDLMRHGLQMSVVDARRRSAKVVEFKPIGNRADEMLVGEAVGRDADFPDLNMEPSVSSFAMSSLPEPAGSLVPQGTVLVDFQHESVDWGRAIHRTTRKGVPVPTPTAIVHFAHTQTRAWARALRHGARLWVESGCRSGVAVSLESGVMRSAPAPRKERFPAVLNRTQYFSHADIIPRMSVMRVAGV